MHPFNAPTETISIELQQKLKRIFAGSNDIGDFEPSDAGALLAAIAKARTVWLFFPNDLFGVLKHTATGAIDIELGITMRNYEQAAVLTAAVVEMEDGPSSARMQAIVAAMLTERGERN